LFLQLLTPFRRDPRTFGSEFSELPVFEEGDSSSRRDYRLLAGGLALLLSRCPARVIERDFSASANAFRSLRRQFRRASAAVALPPGLLNDLAHEIAQYADAATRGAALRCLQRAAQPH
jgi:hypothetical protein